MSTARSPMHPFDDPQSVAPRERLLVLALLAAVVASSALVAQAKIPKQVIGITHSAVWLTRKAFEPGTCASRFCHVAGFETRVPTWRAGEDQNNPTTWSGTAAGGSAYDGRSGGVWISNGTRLALVEPETCAVIVPVIDVTATNSPIPAPDPTPWKKVITGLCFVESGAGGSASGPGWLFISWMSNHISKVEVSRSAQGQWQFKTSHCLFTHDVDDGHCKIAGLAADDVGRNLLVGTSCFAPLAGVRTAVHITDMDAANWCTRTCFFRFPVLDPRNAGPLSPSDPLCPNLGWNDQTLVTGLAYDSCETRLYVTDGDVVVYGQLPIDATGTTCGVVVKNAQNQNVRIYQLEGCCGLSLRSQAYTGIAVYPNTSRVGSACSKPPCAPCTQIRAGTIGAAILGNPDFALKVTGAPDNWSRMVLGVGVGPCSASGVQIGMCAAITVATQPVLPLLWFFQNPAPGGAVCNAGHVLPTGRIPVDPALCGIVLSSQWVIECGASSGIGHALSDCFEFEIQG